MGNIRLLIVDDHIVVRQGLVAMLTSRYGMEIVGEACDGHEALQKAIELKPDVIIMDLNMPEMDGIEATIAIRRADPSARILVLTSFNEEDRAAAIMVAGASGYLLKDSGADELIQAIRSVHSGHLVVSRSVMQAMTDSTRSRPAEPPPLDELTPRGLEVLRGMVDGLTNQGIAVRMGISATTVRSHVSNVLMKLGVTNRTQAAMIARERGIT
jgi:NarL family two-component system response regulator LiaR